MGHVVPRPPGHMRAGLFDPVAVDAPPPLLAHSGSGEQVCVYCSYE